MVFLNNLALNRKMDNTIFALPLVIDNQQTNQ